MNNLFLVAFGGALGSVLRFLVNSLFPFQGVGFPKATFIVNIFASLILGLITGLLLYKLPNNDWLKYFIAIGLCGGFSTFSTFALELYKFQESTQHFMLIGYTLSSIIFSVSAIYFGIFLVKNLI